MRDYLNLGLIITVVCGIAFLSTGNFSAPSGAAPVGHFLMYFTLAGSFLMYFQGKKHTHLDAVALAVLTGLFFELVQSQIPYRSFSLLDASVNGLGASLVLFERYVPVVHRVVSLEDRIIESVLEK